MGRRQKEGGEKNPVITFRVLVKGNYKPAVNLQLATIRIQIQLQLSHFCRPHAAWAYKKQFF